MFASQTQIHRAMKLLLRDIAEHLGPLWSDRGPTKAFEDEDHMSSGEHLMTKVALDFWNQRGNASLGECLRTMDPRRLGRVTRLLAAVVDGPAAVDAWINAEIAK